MRAFWTILTLLFVGGCSGVEALNRLSPEGGITTSRNLAYGSGPRRSVDIYRPAAAGPAPVVLFFYGGSWQEGDKADYAFMARALAEAGIVVVVADYRVYPEVRFEGFMQDAASAFAWTQKNAARFGGDPNRVVVAGHSAGAHMAAMLTLDRQWLAAHGLEPRRAIAGMVGLAGPYDFLPLEDPILKIIFGAPERLARTQPITFVDGRNPPMFLATGNLDTTVYPKNTHNLARAIRAAGGPVVEKTYATLSHRTVIGVLSKPLGFVSSVRRDVTDFVLSVPPSGLRVSSR